MNNDTIKWDFRILEFLKTKHSRIDDPGVYWAESHASAHRPQRVLIETLEPDDSGTIMLRCSVCGAQHRLQR